MLNHAEKMHAKSKNVKSPVNRYDWVAQKLINSTHKEGYFGNLSAEELIWFKSTPRLDSSTPEILKRRLKIVETFYQNIPEYRDRRLKQAHEQVSEKLEAYQREQSIYLELKRQLSDAEAETFAANYQNYYLKALAGVDVPLLEADEAPVVEAGVASTPLLAAQNLAKKFFKNKEDAISLPETCTLQIKGVTLEVEPKAVLETTAKAAAALLAAGSLLATRFNYLNNFAWFGASIWRAFTQVELALTQLQDPKSPSLLAELDTAKGLVLQLVHAHRTGPVHSRKQWYGQSYGYLTRDLIDAANQFIDKTNALIDASPKAPAQKIQKSPLLLGRPHGRFFDHAHLGRKSELGKLARAVHLIRCLHCCIKYNASAKRLIQQPKSPRRRHEAWKITSQLMHKMLKIAKIEVEIKIHPDFKNALKSFGLPDGNFSNILFLPNHQSVLDHMIMYETLNSSELSDALQWNQEPPCTMVARSGLAKSIGVKLGRKSILKSIVKPESYDRFLKELDEHVVIDIENPKPSSEALKAALKKGPTCIYPMATTAAFANQCFPYQHAIFTQLPKSTIAIPVTLRGAHALWPKCPKGNMNINPGKAEVLIGRPLSLETLLLPRRGALRLQTEAIALFQALHIAEAFDPELQYANL